MYQGEPNAQSLFDKSEQIYRDAREIPLFIQIREGLPIRVGGDRDRAELLKISAFIGGQLDAHAGKRL